MVHLSYCPCSPAGRACQPSNHREESNNNQRTYRQALDRVCVCVCVAVVEQY